MAKTRPHPQGYHKDPEAKEACWACSDPELLDFTNEDVVFAKWVMQQGYHQISSKYRLLARLQLPPFASVVTCSPEVPEWMRKHLEISYDDWIRRMAAEYGEKLELTPGQFRAFKKLERES